MSVAQIALIKEQPNDGYDLKGMGKWTMMTMIDVHQNVTHKVRRDDIPEKADDDMVEIAFAPRSLLREIVWCD